MWSEILTAVWCSAIVAGVVYYYATMKGYDEGMHDVLDLWKQHEVKDERERRERLEQRGVVDPRGRVPLLGWVAVVPSAQGAQADAEAGDVGGDRVASRDEAATREVSEDQVVELEEWFRTKEQRHGE